MALPPLLGSGCWPASASTCTESPWPLPLLVCYFVLPGLISLRLAGACLAVLRRHWRLPLTEDEARELATPCLTLRQLRLEAPAAEGRAAIVPHPVFVYLVRICSILSHYDCNENPRRGTEEMPVRTMTTRAVSIAGACRRLRRCAAARRDQACRLPHADAAGAAALRRRGLASEGSVASVAADHCSFTPHQIG